MDELHERKLPRVAGTAVFPHPTKDTTPLALRQNVEFNQVLHEHVVLVTVKAQNVPYVSAHERICVDPLVHTDDGIVHLELSFGFQDEQDIPAALRQAVGMSDELSFDPDGASYFLSRLSIRRGTEQAHEEDAEDEKMATWRKRLFIGLVHNAANPAASFCLPDERTVVMGAHIDL